MRRDHHCCCFAAHGDAFVGTRDAVAGRARRPLPPTSRQLPPPRAPAVPPRETRRGLEADALMGRGAAERGSTSLLMSLASAAPWDGPGVAAELLQPQLTALRSDMLCNPTNGSSMDSLTERRRQICLTRSRRASNTCMLVLVHVLACACTGTAVGSLSTQRCCRRLSVQGCWTPVPHVRVGAPMYYIPEGTAVHACRLLPVHTS